MWSKTRSSDAVQEQLSVSSLVVKSSGQSRVGKEPVKGTSDRSPWDARKGRLLWARLPLDTSDGAYKVLDNEVLSGLGLDQNATRRARVFGLGGRAHDDGDLAFVLKPSMVRKIGLSEGIAPARGDDPLRVVVRMGREVLNQCCVEPIDQAILAKSVSTCEAACRTQARECRMRLTVRREGRT